ncbi:fatty acid desaturase-domain-containing protein [Rhodofomes roseus]|uniref:Delta 8-(E)-sphingolipid desaturase n=1 Tax=Rhodofomes roseus TaxID=34475 RepID=A0ABQ8KH47_9APHY|nr:fatty acid desaturase-domain-containing protein [Rhodofomes roseus]KAH9837185.1 fatty acid desaturase-domain-containing protein [Rhodofomes roseus]
MGRPSPLWTREQVAARILAGETLVILDDQVIRVPPSWLASHPGGVLAILHFVGRDATDEIHAFHSQETLRRMKGYVVGILETGDGGWLPLVPPIMNGWVRRLGADGKPEWYNEATAVKSSEHTPSAPASEILLIKRADCAPASQGPSLSTLQPPPTTLTPKLQAQHSAAYKELHKRVVDAGLYETPFLTGYGPEVVRYTLLGAFAAFFYSKGWLVPSAICLGLFWQQLTFFAHDLGHVGVTHNWVYDRLIAIFVADFLGGLSIGWWVNNHNVHHLVTNHPTHDPDIQHLPFFAISTAYFKSLYSSYYKRVMVFDSFSKLLISVQHKLYYFVLSLARFNLYALSYTYLAKTAFEPKRAVGGRWWWWSEIFGLGLFYCWYLNVLSGCGTWRKALLYLLISHIAASPVHVQIVLSHFSRSTEDLGVTESFFARQLRTTVDVICSPSIEFIHGGLHLQVTHHMFPRLSRHNLRKASELVKEFAKEQGLEYAEFGFVEGNGDVLGVLKAVSDQMKIMGMVADAEITEAIKGHD